MRTIPDRQVAKHRNPASWARTLGIRMAAAGMAVLAVVSAVRADQITSGADFLKIEAGSRGVALGQSYTALAGDANALAWNPAGLGFMKRTEVSYLRLNHLADTAYHYAGLGVPIHVGAGKLGLGAGLIQYGTSAFDSTLGVAPAAAFSDMAGLVGAAYGTRTFAFGVDGKFLMRDVGGTKGYGWAFDAGAMARPGRGFSLGLTGQHLGPLVHIGSSRERLPSLMKLGLAWTFLETAEHALTVTADQALQFSSVTYRAGGGLEYVFHQLFALRGGFAGDHDRRDLTAGAGLDLDVFQLDYAYVPFGKLGTTHRLSALLRFGKPDDPNRGLRPPAKLLADPFDGSALVNWSEVRTKDVVGYHLHVRRPGAAEFRQLTKEPLKTTSVKLRKLQNGQSYEVGVTSVTATGKQSRMVRVPVVPDPARSAQHLELVPIGVKAELTAEGLVLTWEPSVNALGYHLYLLDENGGAPRRLNRELLAEARVELRKLRPERTYRFQVTALAVDGTESRPSLPVEARLTASSVQLPTPTPSPTTTPPASPTAEPAALMPPVPLRVAPGEGSAELAWDPVEGASGYRVWVSTDGGVNFRLLTPQATTALTVKLQNLKPRPYLFAVTSVAPDGRESVKAIAQPVSPR